MVSSARIHAHTQQCIMMVNSIVKFHNYEVHRKGGYWKFRGGGGVR